MNFEAFCENSKFVVFVTICDCACMRISSRIAVPAALQSNRVSINAFVISHFITARVACDCRVQSLRRPDAAEKGNNVALIVDHGPFEGSVAIAASERVTLIQ